MVNVIADEGEIAYEKGRKRGNGIHLLQQIIDSMPESLREGDTVSLRKMVRVCFHDIVSDDIALLSV